MIIVDSDILIWILRDNEDYKSKFRKVAENYNGQLYITPIQYMEILTGVREKELLNTTLFLDSFQFISIDKEIGKLAGNYLKCFSKSHSVHNADALIAATAKIYDFKVWTNNKKHYPMFSKVDFLE